MASGVERFFLRTGKTAEIATELKPHQARVVERLQDEDQRGLVAVHGLGSGKTLTSLAAADALGMPTDAVVPAALQGNFSKEINKHIVGQGPQIDIQSLENTARKGGRNLENKFLIVDEAHRARNPGKTQTALMQSPAAKRLLLTGSLVYNQPSDMAGPINLVAGRATLPTNPADFEKFFIRNRVEKPGFFGKLMGKEERATSDINPSSREYLRQVLKKYVDYHPGSSEGFPTREDQVVKVPMHDSQTAIYDTLMDKAPSWVKDRVLSGMPPRKSETAQLNAFLSGTRQVANTTTPFRSNEPQYQPKIDKAVSELHTMLNTNPRAKAIVYSNYLDAGINPYKRQLDELKLPYGEFTGQMGKSQRDQLVRDYNENKLRALLLSSAGGEGLDLKGTSLIQLLEPHWNEEKLKQVIGRGIRFKSHDHLPEEERKVLIQRYLATRPPQGILERLNLRKPGQSVDEYLYGLAQQKEQLNEQFRDLYRQKTSANKFESMLMSGKLRSPDTAQRIKAQFGMIPRPGMAAKNKALDSAATTFATKAPTLPEGSSQHTRAIRALRERMYLNRLPPAEELQRTRRKFDLSLKPRMRELGGQVRTDLDHWRNAGEQMLYGPRKAFATHGQFNPATQKLRDELGTQVTPFRDLYLSAANEAKQTGVIPSVKPGAGSLFVYKDLPTFLRKRQATTDYHKQLAAGKADQFRGQGGLSRFAKSKGYTNDFARPYDPSETRSIVEHEAGEKALLSRNRPTTAYSTHAGAEADIRAMQVKAQDPAVWEFPGNSDSFIEKDHWKNLYKQHGGTPGRPIAPDSHAAQSMDHNIARLLAKAPINKKTLPDLDMAMTQATQGVPVHPVLEERLRRDFGKLNPGLAAEVKRVEQRSPEELRASADEILRRFGR